MNSISISVGIPAYRRPKEYSELLESLRHQTRVPDEIVVCENNSPERLEIREISSFYADLFAKMGCQFNYIENSENIGLDANLRKVISCAKGDYIFFVGNDDFVMPNGIESTEKFLKKHDVLAGSRHFYRFKTDPLKPIGISRFFDADQIILKHTHPSNYALRLGAFISGVFIKRQWAIAKETSRFDGTLFYQIYLLLHAYVEGQIGYLATATVAARVDNPPQFGDAAIEKQNFAAGSYSVKARAKMWEAILKIAQDVETNTQVKVVAGIKNELTVKMSFHVFEMFAGASKSQLLELRSMLIDLDLYKHIFPKLLYAVNIVLGRYSNYFYRAVRKLMQRV